MFAMGCGSPSSAGPSETGTWDSESESGTEAGAETGPEPVCVPGEQRCTDAGVGVETCDDTGLGWSAQACESYAACTVCVDDGDPLCEGRSVRCAGPCDPSPDAPSSMGCSFVTVWMPWGRKFEPETQELVVSNPDPQRAATVSLSSVALGTRDESPVGEPVLVEPGESATFTIEAPFLISETSLLTTGGVYRIASDLPLSVTQQGPPLNTGGPQSWVAASMLLLPELSFRGDFVVSAAKTKLDQFLSESYFIVVALEDDTQVTWTSPVETPGNGAPVPPLEAGELGSLQLNRFDQLQVTASKPLDQLLGADMTGAVVTADKAVAVFAGSPCGQLQLSSRSCDPMFEQLIPIEYWGRTYVVPPVLDRSTTERDELMHFRVLAGDAGVTVTDALGGAMTPIAFQERGESSEQFLDASSGVVLRGDGPFAVTHYPDDYEVNPGPLPLAYGDTAMTQVVPVEQYLDRYVVHLDERWDKTALDFVRRAGGPEVTFAGLVVQDWAPLGDYEWARVQFSDFTATAIAESEGPFGLSVYAYGPAPLPFDDAEDVGGAHPAGLGFLQLTVP